MLIEESWSGGSDEVVCRVSIRMVESKLVFITGHLLFIVESEYNAYQT